MAFYTHKDKVSGDGLALTEWNTLSTAVAGNSGLTLAKNPADNVGIGTDKPTSKLTVAGDVNIGGQGDAKLRVRHVEGKKTNSADTDPLYLNWETGKDVNVGGRADANLNVFGKIYAQGNVGIGTDKPTSMLTVAGDVNIGGQGFAILRVRQINGKKTNSADTDQLFLNWDNGMDVHVGGVKDANLNVSGNIYANGKVGIGTSNPTSMLTVAGDVNIGGQGDATLRVRHLEGKKTNSADTDPLYLNWYTGKDVHVGGGTADANLRVSGNIYANGNVGVGTNNPTSKLTVAGDVNIGGQGNGILRVREIRGKKTNSADADPLYLNYDTGKDVYVGGAINANLRVSGDIHANGWTSTSDASLKTNVLKEEGILSRMMNLNVVSFNWRDNPDAHHKPIGFIAQEVMPWFPSLVGEFENPETKKTNMTLGYMSFGVLAVGAIQELKKEHDAKIAALELEIARLKQQMAEA